MFEPFFKCSISFQVTDQDAIAELCVKVDNQKLLPKTCDELDSETFHEEKQTQKNHASSDFLIVYATPEGNLDYIKKRIT